MLAQCLRWFGLVSMLLANVLPAQNLPPYKTSTPPNVVTEIRHDQSRPLREMGENSIAPAALPSAAMPLRPIPKSTFFPTAPLQMPHNLAAPSALTSGSMPAPLIQWDGMRNTNFVVPPDTNGDVGPNHYMQWVNLSLAIWDKKGNLLFGPKPGNVLWSGFGAPCETNNNGDPVVLYDGLADRWLASQFSVPTGGPFYQCVAVSASPDPTGSWNRYAFLWSTSKMNDYPKFGVWPDGYYMTVNQFGLQNQWAGAGVAVFERERMLQNQPARMISFDLFNADANFGGMLPADLDGTQAPPTGAPDIFAEWDESTTFLNDPSDMLRLWNFHADWNDPSLSTFGVNLQPNAIIPTSNVNSNLAAQNWISQKGTARGLDPISDRLMNRLQYRNFGDHQTLVSNHTVDTGGLHAGIHWFELRKPAGGNWGLQQDGVLAPDANNRWMGSAAMDGSGNMALGYSLSGTAAYPSIAYSGRLVSDPPGTLAQSETLLVSGGSAQTSVSRWGDYSMLAVDPSNDCTFWYTQEYYDAAPGWGSDWRTRIGAFKFPSCNQPSTGLLQGTVRSSLAGNSPVTGAKVAVGATEVYTGSDGSYQLSLPTGAINVQVSAFGYLNQTGPATIFDGAMTTLDFSLVPAPMAQVSGKVSDGAGHYGMPLYARIDIPGVPASPIFTDPVSGQYQVDLMAGSAVTFTVTAVLGGYQPAVSQVTPVSGGSTQDFGLSVAAPPVCPLGYQALAEVCQPQAGGLVVGKVQDANNPPNALPAALVGASVTDSLNANAAVSRANPPSEYFLFTDPGQRSLRAAYPGYTSLSLPQVMVLADAAVNLNFNLPAGYLQVAPAVVNQAANRIAPLSTATLTIKNLGSDAASFTLTEFAGPAPQTLPSGPYAPAGRRLSPKSLIDLTAQKIYEYLPPAAPAWPGGGVVARSWPTGLAAPWGLSLTPQGEVWVGDAPSGGGDGRLHRYQPDGTPLGGSAAAPWNGAYGADLAYDPLRMRMWQVNVGGDNCIGEMAPQAMAASGVRICPAFGNSQRGLAYDPASQTFYSGTWNDGIISHFDRAGVILDSAATGINIAGLAYQPVSGHLYALSNASQGYDVYVLDARHGYAILGGFDIPGLANFGQAGLDLAPDGSLWVVDELNRTVLQVSSGEAGFSPLVDVAWLGESLTTADIPAGGTQSVTLTMNGTGLTPGSYQAYLQVTTNTPYDNTAYKIVPITVSFTVMQNLTFLPFVGKK